MLAYIFLAAASVAAFWLYSCWLRVKSYWAVRGVTHEPPNVILGSLTFIQRQNPVTWLRRLYALDKDYVGIWFLWRPGLVINSPEIARRILVRDFGNFKNRYAASGDKDPIGALNLFAVKDPIWSSIRQRLTSVFTAAKLRSHQDYIRRKSQELVQRIRANTQTPLNLRVMFADYTTDIIGTFAFGVESNATITGKSTLRDITIDFGKYSLFRGLSWCSIFFFPDVVDLFRFKFFSKFSTDYFQEVYRKIMKTRTNKILESKDLIDVLLKYKQERIDNNEAVSEDLLVAQAAIFLQAGFETSGTALSTITYELAFLPEIQDRLYEELKEATERNGTCLNLQILSELTYLNAIIKEGLRKYPPMGWLDRICAADYKIDDKLTIKAGTPVYVNLAGMHTDPGYFSQPEKFDPERFLPENEKDIKPYVYMPFGEGPRNCIGLRFAQMTLRFALSCIFLNFTVHPLPDKPKPADIKPDTRSLLFLPGEPLLLKFNPRIEGKS